MVNIVNVGTINSKHQFIATVGTGSGSSFTAVPSNKIWRVNSLILSNVDGVNNVDATVVHNDGAGTDYTIYYTLVIPADGALVALDRTMGVNLTAGETIKVIAGAAGDLNAILYYDEISE